MLFSVMPASAAPSNETVNFSARLKNATGSVVPEGYYNISFSLYNQESGGTPLWSETYYDGNGESTGQDNRVKVVNGYFNVKLGSRTAFPTIDWSSDLWLTMNIGGTEQVAVPANISWDGEMTPRIQLAAVPYAMSAKTVGGKSANQLVQLGQGTQIDNSNNASIDINKTGSGDLLHLQSSGNDAFTLHNNGSITLGATGDQSIAVGTAPSGVGHNLSVAAGAGESGGTLSLQGGDATNIDGDGGDVAIDAGAGGENGSGGNLSLGSTNASSITIGNSGSTTKVVGQLNLDSIDVSSAGPLVIGGTNATSIDLGQDTSVHGQLAVQDDGANAFQVQNANGDQMFNVDSSNNLISIGTIDANATLLVLDTKTTPGDPSGTNGAMYYNSSSKKFRCYEDGNWKDCVTPLPVSKIAETDTSNDTTAPVDVDDLSFDLAADTKYYYKFIVIHEASDDTTGIGFGVTTPTSPVLNNWCTNTTATLESATTGHWGSYCGVGDASATTSGTENQGTKFTSTIEGYIKTGEQAGELKLRMKSEKTEEVTVKSGSFGILQIVQ